MTDGRDFLSRLHNAVQRVGWRAPGDPAVLEAIERLVEAGNTLTAATGSAAISLLDPVAVDGVAIDGAAIEFAGLIGGLRERGIEGVSLSAPIDGAEMAALVGFAAAGDPMEPGRSVRVIDRGTTPPSRVSSSSLPRLVAEACDTLRSIPASGIALDAVRKVAEPLASAAVADPDRAFLQSLEGFRHPEIPERSAGIALLATVIAERMGTDRHSLGLVASAGLLADVGLLVEPEVDVRDHPVVGASALMRAGGPAHELVAAVALEHHRRFDGSGYPRLERAIHGFSVIVGVADAFGHLVGGWGGRSARLPAEAVHILRASAGVDLDPKAVTAFVDAFGEPPPGSVVRLSGGEVVLVTTSTGRALVVTDATGARLEVPEPVDLVDRTVVASVQPEEFGVSITDLAGGL
jgi:hypothetical protein